MKNLIKIIISIIIINISAADTIADVQKQTTNPEIIIEKPLNIEDETEEENMFAPIELDLTDYTQKSKKNKKFKLIF